MHDTLGLLTEADVLEIQRAPRPRPPIEITPTRRHWSEKYRNMDQYNWDDSEWKKQNRGKYAFLPIPLTQGYFMIVSLSDYRRMVAHRGGTPKRWQVNLVRDQQGDVQKAYAHRRVRSYEYAETQRVRAHREIVGVHRNSRGVVDHIWGEGLDNRRPSLDYTSQSINVHNSLTVRRKNTGLLRGVEKRGKNAKGQQLYGGIRAKRINKTKSVVFRSKRTWLSQERANRWYLNQLKRLHRRVTWASDRTSARPPLFPPRKQGYPAVTPRYEYTPKEAAIPFF